MDFTESSFFGSDEESRYKKKEPIEKLPFREKLENWLTAAKETKELYGENALAYDPNDYSIDEWEAYLLKKNNNLNIEQFIRRRRWNIKFGSDEGEMAEYLKKFFAAKENSHEF